MSRTTAQDCGNCTQQINGKTFVLVPADDYPLYEKAIAELPAVRAENQALRDKAKADEELIKKDAELLLLKDALQAKTEEALKAQTARADALALANEANKKALAVSEGERARLEKKVKTYRRYAMIGTVAATIATIVLLRRP